MLNAARRPLANPKLWQWALAVYWIVLIVTTHVPQDVPLVPSGGVDKPIHLVAFAVLAALFATTWQLSAGWLTARHLRWAWIVIVLYGAFDELTQPLFGRQASVADWFSDALGALLGLALFVWLRRWFASARNPVAPRQRPL